MPYIGASGVTSNMLISNTLEIHSRKIGVGGRVFIQYHQTMVYDGLEACELEKMFLFNIQKRQKDAEQKSNKHQMGMFFVPLNFCFKTFPRF